MSVIWIVEKRKEAGLSAASVLMGDFAVRVFASVSSLETVLRFDRRSQPELVVLDLQDIERSITEVCDFLRTMFPHTPTLWLSDVRAQTDERPGATLWVEKPVDGLRLSSLASYLIRNKSGGSKAVVRYKDVLLDLERLHCLVLPDEVPVPLPLKEAQLLKLLLERPGVCLSRAEIHEQVWTDVRVSQRTIDSHISRLRRRIGHASLMIESVYGGGYVLR